MADLYRENRLLRKGIKAVLFDKDGTLVDIHHYWTSIIRLRAEKLSHKFESNASSLMEAMGIDTLTNRMKPEGPVGVKPRAFIVGVVAGLLGSKASTSEVEGIFKEVDTLTERDLKPYLTLLPGVRSFLEKCNSSNVELAVVTTDQTRRANLAFEALNLIDFFDVVVGADAVNASKPAPDAGFKSMETLGVAAADTVMIGDHLVDIQMGLNCGIPTRIAVLTGLGRETDFKGVPCEIVPTFESLDIR